MEAIPQYHIVVAISVLGVIVAFNALAVSFYKKPTVLGVFGFVAVAWIYLMGLMFASVLDGSIRVYFVWLADCIQSAAFLGIWLMLMSREYETGHLAFKNKTRCYFMYRLDIAFVLPAIYCEYMWFLTHELPIHDGILHRYINIFWYFANSDHVADFLPRILGYVLTRQLLKRYMTKYPQEES